MQYYAEPGLIYDCLLFLSLCLEESDAGNTYMEVKGVLKRNGVSIPKHLSPLFCRQAKHRSYLQKVIFDEWAYSQCSFTKVEHTLKNPTYMKRRLAEFYFPGLDPGSLQKVIQVEYPDFIGLLNKESSLSEQQANLLFILVHFNEAMRETAEIIGSVRAEIEKRHRQIAAQNSEKLKVAPVTEKLRAISNTAREKTPVRFSFTLLDEGRISCRPEEPDFFILGSRFDEVLETRYKYREVTPVSFIRALGSEAKCLIFEALLDEPEMSAADMEVRLHLSRNAVARNIKELREFGIVTVKRTEGLSYYYTLNREYIGIVAEQLERLKYHEIISAT